MPKDYIEVVFDAYKKKKTERVLSSNLLNPTPGNLRQECLIVCREKYEPKDHEVLRLFFSDGSKEKGYIKSIEESPAKKFKQMSKILKGADVKNPGLKYFELLEWLMDLNLGTSTSYYKSFYEKPKVKEDSIIESEEELNHDEDNSKGDNSDILTRDAQKNIKEKDHANNVGDETSDSLQKDMSNDTNKPTIPIVVVFDNSTTKAPTIDVLEPHQELKEEVINDPKTPMRNGDHGEDKLTQLPFLERLILWLERGPNSNKKKFVVTLIPVALAVFGIYTFFEYVSTQCMYWTGDQYQSVGCSVKVDHATVIALDKQKLVGLKRINRLDTITEKDLGKVWYVKIKQDSAEFYTDSGTYPLNTKKRLMPMTPYILNKYILHK